MFKILYYCPTSENTELDILNQVIEHGNNSLNIDYCDTDSGLSTKLKDFKVNYDAVIFAAESIEQLKILIDHRDLLQHKDLILIIPDENEDILKLANTLYPRFICYLGNNYSFLESVLKKMIIRGKIRKED